MKAWWELVQQVVAQSVVELAQEVRAQVVPAVPALGRKLSWHVVGAGGDT